jgi:hypothetical protein
VTHGRAQAIMTAQRPFFHAHSRLIAELALKHKLPNLLRRAAAADAEMLMTPGASIRDRIFEGRQAGGSTCRTVDEIRS